MGKALLDPFRRRRLSRCFVRCSLSLFRAYYNRFGEVGNLSAYPTKLRGFTTGGRNLAFSLVPSVLGAAGVATPSPTPYSKLEAITDPARAGSELSLVEWVCRSFAITIDGLSAFLSQMLGPWSQCDLFLQVTPAKLILGFLSALLILVLLRIARRILKRIRHEPKTDATQRHWIDGLLHAFRKGLGLFAWITALFVFVSPLLPHLAIALNSQAPFEIASRLAEIGYFLSLVVFCYYTVRLVGGWLNQLAQRQPRRWYDPTFPLVGQLIYYNFLLISFQYLIELLRLPGSAAAISSKVVSIVSILVNTVMVIQMVRALEDIAMVRTEHHGYDTYRYRGITDRADQPDENRRRRAC